MLEVTVPTKDRFQGSLIGQCLGDALGAPVEGMSPKVCRAYVETRVRGWLTENNLTGSEIIGQYTDDSQLARDLMRSLVECRSFNPEHYAGLIAEIFRTDQIVGRGIATGEAAARLIDGISWREAGCTAPTAGNGSAMRAGPIGLFHHDNIEQLIETARDQSWITHQDERCLAGSVAIAGAVALAARSTAIEVADFVAKLAALVRHVNKPFAEYIETLLNWVTLDPEQASAKVIPLGREPGHVEGWPGISPFVVSSVVWSLFAFLRHPENYTESICTAIAAGGDVDTTAAMTGAISGAYNGLASLPQHLTMRLNDHGAWEYHELLEIADSCYDCVMAGVS
jgi:ADP-ribosylglycohydrolase